MRQAAAYMNVAERTVLRLMKRGLPYVKLSNGRHGGVRIKRQWIDQWLERKKRSREPI